MLAHTLHSLPPILHIMYQISLPSYSKGSRGLSVPLRLSGIFTAAAISLSIHLRQRPDRYAIRAGQNLPDKEFRYLRTVIVTAAVYWGFNSELAPILLTFQHRAGVTPYTSSYEFAECYVFVKQSPGPLICNSFLLHLLTYLCRFAVRSTYILLRGFSRKQGINDFAGITQLVFVSRIIIHADLPTQTTYILKQTNP